LGWLFLSWSSIYSFSPLWWTGLFGSSYYWQAFAYFPRISIRGKLKTVVTLRWKKQSGKSLNLISEGSRNSDLIVSENAPIVIRFYASKENQVNIRHHVQSATLNWMWELSYKSIWKMSGKRWRCLFLFLFGSEPYKVMNIF